MDQVREFDIARSFAGEDRLYVDQVANLLRESGIKVFYDLFEEGNLWGKNLYDYLSDIYMNKALYTIMFISKHYARKLWPTHERQAMQARAFQENQEYILPARFDETPIPGVLPTVGFLKAEGEEIAIMFDDLRRSNADFKLAAWKRNGLLNDEQLAQFSEETQETIRSLNRP